MMSPFSLLYAQYLFRSNGSYHNAFDVNLLEGQVYVHPLICTLSPLIGQKILKQVITSEQPHNKLYMILSQ